MTGELPPHAQALGRIPSGLFILSAGTGDQATATLVSFVQQVGFEPPVVVVALKKGRFITDLITEHGVFCLAVLHEQSRHLVAHFARGFDPGEEAFAGLPTARTDDGVVYPEEALAHVVCHYQGAADWCDHMVLFGKVVGGDIKGEADPLVHLRKNGLNY